MPKQDAHQPGAIEALELPIEDNAVTDELTQPEQGGSEAEHTTSGKNTGIR
jgi:hypothetical protein